MKKLLKYLSPFAPDQSGASGVLYELGGLIVICDAGGCAGNICGFDEPRWFTQKSAVFSAGLRDMDAIMGRDDRLIAKLKSAQESLNCSFSAIIGTPVPAVIATDMKALKRMAEKSLGIPSITITCDGTKYYDKGEEDAWLALFREFVGKAPISGADDSGKENSDSNTEKELIGIIGATPLETGYSSDAPLKNALKTAGINNALIYSMGSGLSDIISAGNVSKNIVVSAQALKTAQYLKETYGTPYEVGYPFIPDSVVSAVISKINNKHKKILILHSQFAANELRTIIRSFHSNRVSSDDLQIDCATFFIQSPDYTEEQDYMLSDEDELFELASEERYDLIIGDGDLQPLLKAAGYRRDFIDYPHFAISGRTND